MASSNRSRSPEGRRPHRMYRRFRYRLRALFARRTTPAEQLRALGRVLPGVVNPRVLLHPQLRVPADQPPPPPLPALQLIPVRAFLETWIEAIGTRRERLEQKRVARGARIAVELMRSITGWGRTESSRGFRGPWTASMTAINTDYTWMRNMDPSTPVIHSAVSPRIHTVTANNNSSANNSHSSSIGDALNLTTRVLAIRNTASLARLEAMLLVRWLQASAAHPATYTARGTPAVTVIHATTSSPPSATTNPAAALWEIQLRLVRGLLELLPREDVLFPVPRGRSRHRLSRGAFARFLGHRLRGRDYLCRRGIEAMLSRRADTVPFARRVDAGIGILEELAALRWYQMSATAWDVEDEDVVVAVLEPPVTQEAAQPQYRPPPQPQLVLVVDLTSVIPTRTINAQTLYRFVWALEALAARNGAVLLVVGWDGACQVVVGDASRAEVGWRF